MGRPEYLRDLESNGEDSSTRRDWATILIWSVFGFICLLVLLVHFSGVPLLALGLGQFLFQQDQAPFLAFSNNTGHFEKPDGIKIVALVPFRQHERTSILDCYLQRNLVHNNGFLDKVVFVPQTGEEESLRWLNSVVRQTPAYYISHSSSGDVWDIAEKGTLYIRIDGDVVFLEENTIPTIVRTKLQHPDALMVSANVIHQPVLASLHNHAGVALSYLPELHHVSQPARSTPQRVDDWRLSDLPPWEGPADFRIQKEFQPPFKNHRWLLSNDSERERTPIAATMHSDEGPGWSHWTVSAQRHYSFLHHLEEGDLRRYKFPLWVDPTGTVSEDFVCIWGDDVIAARTVHQSQQTSNVGRPIPKKQPRKHIIDGKGVVSHYSAEAGVQGLDSTDILQRYRGYAREMVCLNAA
ncbi:hypothetical protein VTN02DRAFT_2568 [Thermoascus thermophilus]